ncbi:hypothetical protein HanPI659440_Chr09g0334721 [Helianthus annuus]|nr:hypothetical protein HanPI659440_Chr09g0334721 [Helianthus annuus]
MAMASQIPTFRKAQMIVCRKKEKGRDQNYPYKVIEITPPPRNLGIRCFPSVSILFYNNMFGSYILGLKLTIICVGN